jgi:general secretion pathway protein M
VSVEIKQWYAARSPRERRLLLMMAAIAAPLLVWLLLVAPLGNAYDEALQRHLQAVDRNGRVKALAARAAGGDVKAPVTVQDLALFLGDSAAYHCLISTLTALPST